jgi:hypothetical protein
METPAMEQVSRWLAAKPKFLSMYVCVAGVMLWSDVSSACCGFLTGRFVEESPSHEEEVTVAEDEIPDGWMSSVDDTTGKTFYYNEETGESRWERPNLKVEVVDDVSKDEASVVIGSDADVQEQETGEEAAKEAEE